MLRPLMSLVDEPPLMVSELVDHSNAVWREEVVRQVFLPIDAQAILAIPLCTAPIDDFGLGITSGKGFFQFGPLIECWRPLS